MKIVSVSALLFFCFTAFGAESSTYYFEGSISRVLEADYIGEGSNGLGEWEFEEVESSRRFPETAFSLGDHFSGYLSFDQGAELLGVSDDGAQAIYRPLSYSLFLDCFDLDFDGYNSFSIVDDRMNHSGPYDAFFASAQGGQGTPWFFSSSIFLQDRTGLVFEDQSIPEMLDTQDFSYGSMRLAFLERSTDDQLQIRGDLTTFTLVPEPTTAVLVGLGLIGLGVRRRVS